MMLHAETALLGLTTTHICFAGSRKESRVRYDRIVTLDLYHDGFGIMRDPETVKPWTFRTGEGWSTRNLTTNLPHLQG